MIEKVLHINQVMVSEGPTEFVCFGLGSCIGLFVIDRLKGFSAGAHIPMPVGTQGDFHGANEMIECLLQKLQQMGSSLVGLSAKLAGGAQVYESTLNMGIKNTEAVLLHLSKHNIYISGSDVGGKISRTARFNSVTGDLKISTSEKKEYII